MGRRILKDSQWKRIEGMLPGKKGDVGVTTKDNKLFVEAVLWIGRTGSPWRDLPKEYGHWHRYVRFNRWSHKGVWGKVFEELSKDADFEYVMIDGSIVRVHQHGAAEKVHTARRSRQVRRRFKYQNPCGS